MSIRELFKNTEKQYHFTNYETAIKILSSKSLKFGRLINMNDLHESGKIIFVDANNNPIKDISSNKLKKIVDEIYKYRQISFTIDKPKKEKLGFDLLQMWGIYADKGEGVCLVFDKEELNIKGLEYIQSQITDHIS